MYRLSSARASARPVCSLGRADEAAVDGAWVAGSLDALAGFILTGGYGPEVLMARFDYLSDAAFAALVSYSRTQFEGIDEAPVPSALVERVRSQLP